MELVAAETLSCPSFLVVLKHPSPATKRQVSDDDSRDDKRNKQSGEMLGEHVSTNEGSRRNRYSARIRACRELFFPIHWVGPANESATNRLPTRLLKTI